MLSSTIIPKNTVEEKTKINLSENSLTRKAVTSNHDSDDNSTDNEQMEKIVHNNPEENVNPIINNSLVIITNNEKIFTITLEEIITRITIF